MFVLILAALAGAFNLPVLDPPGNLGPLNLYPDNREGRLYKMPFDSGQAYNCVRGAFNRPSYTGHKGYEFDFPVGAGHPVLAARAGYVTFINNDVIQISHNDRDSTGIYTTKDWYIHVRTTDIPISIPMYVEQGQLITYVRSDQDHVHLEVQLNSHTGTGYQDRNIESVPVAFFECRRPDGVPFAGDIFVSENKRFVPDAVQRAPVREGTVSFSAAPNPFNASTRFCFAGPDINNGLIFQVFSMDGRLVKNLLAVKSAKELSAVWQTGNTAPGNYFVRIKTKRQSATLSLTHVR